MSCLFPLLNHRRTLSPKPVVKAVKASEEGHFLKVD